MTFAVLISGSAVSGASLLWVFVPVLLLMLVWRQDQPSRRRLLSAGLLVVAMGVALMASDDSLILAPCETCKLIDTSTWTGWLAWWAAGCNWC